MCCGSKRISRFLADLVCLSAVLGRARVSAPIVRSPTMTGWSVCSAPRTASKACATPVTCKRHGKTCAGTEQGALFLGCMLVVSQLAAGSVQSSITLFLCLMVTVVCTCSVWCVKGPLQLVSSMVSVVPQDPAWRRLRYWSSQFGLGLHTTGLQSSTQPGF